MWSVIRQYRVKRRDIMYLRATLESYDGMAVVHTVDPQRAVIELQIGPGCQASVEDLLDDLRQREGLQIERLVTWR